MTEKRPQHGKPGPKSVDEKLRLDSKLRELFAQDGITPWRASIIVQCSYEYAVKKFKEFAILLVESEEQDWIERMDQVRKRALEGISKCIADSQYTIGLLEDQIRMNTEILNATKPRAFEQLQRTEKGQKLIKSLEVLDENEILELVSIVQKYLDDHKTYSLLMLQCIKEFRAERHYIFELHQQFADIELTQPVNQVLEALIEKRIVKNNDKSI